MGLRRLFDSFDHHLKYGLENLLSAISRPSSTLVIGETGVTLLILSRFFTLSFSASFLNSGTEESLDGVSYDFIGSDLDIRTVPEGLGHR